jgi:hypothetical protein
LASLTVKVYALCAIFGTLKVTDVKLPFALIAGTLGVKESFLVPRVMPDTLEPAAKPAPDTVMVEPGNAPATGLPLLVTEIDGVILNGFLRLICMKRLFAVTV